jgi:hypothetical protein
VLNDDLIAGLIASVGPPIDDAGVIGRVVEFRNGESAMVVMDQAADAHLRRLEILQEAMQPATVLARSAGLTARVVVTVETPIVARIREIVPVGDGHLVCFDRSAARHILKNDLPLREQLLDLLNEAMVNRRLVVVREDPFSHDILDASLAEEKLYERMAQPADAPEADGLALPGLDPADVLNELTAVSTADATAFVKEMDTTGSCGLAGAGPNCIPFRYPDNGCWARAHRMCEILEDRGITAGKVWIYGKELTAPTADHPDCRVEWTWHVAAMVKSQELGEPLVLDPPFFDEAVSVDTFKDRLNDATATVALTTMTPYIREPDGRFVIELPFNFLIGRDETESWLKIYRHELETRKPQPPFDHCPKPIK